MADLKIGHYMGFAVYVLFERLGLRRKSGSLPAAGRLPHSKVV